MNAGDWIPEPVAGVHTAGNPCPEPIVAFVSGCIDPHESFRQGVESDTAMP